VIAQPDDGWMVETGEVGQALSVHWTKDEAVVSATEPARAHAPSEVLVNKKDPTVQTARTYG
jgi:hypothetical protein